MPSKQRLKALERRQHHAEAEGPPTEGMHRFSAEEWLEMFEAYKANPRLLAERCFVEELERFRRAIDAARRTPKWEPPANYRPRLPLGERRRYWRHLHRKDDALIYNCIMGLGAAL